MISYVSFTGQIHNDILPIVFHHLSIFDLTKVSSVCKQFKLIATQELYKRDLEEWFPQAVIGPAKWKACCGIEVENVSFNTEELIKQKREMLNELKKPNVRKTWTAYLRPKKMPIKKFVEVFLKTHPEKKDLFKLIDKELQENEESFEKSSYVMMMNGILQGSLNKTLEEQKDFVKTYPFCEICDQASAIFFNIISSVTMDRYPYNSGFIRTIDGKFVIGGSTREGLIVLKHASSHERGSIGIGVLINRDKSEN